MAPPPKYLITRRLIDRYMKSFKSIKADQTTLLQNELFSCWKTHGVESESCHHILMKIKEVSPKQQVVSKYDKAKKGKNGLHKTTEKSLSTMIKEELNKPVFPFEKKGRFRDFNQRPKTIYDGII